MKNHPVIKIFDILYSTHGPQRWWPGDSQFEIIVGAVLTQSTNWHNVTLAITNLKAAELLDPVSLLAAKPERVKALIAPTGFFNVKYKRLKNVLEYLVKHNADSERFRHLPIADLRDELLDINGVGPETADSILLYAFDRPVFVVDAYTRRLFSRLGYNWMKKAKYEAIQKFFMSELPPDSHLYNEFHALIVVHCKAVCKKKPLCPDCSLMQ
jgi:endonuclease-3 related protein